MPAKPLNLRLRKQLAAAIGERLQSIPLTQAQKADRLGITQPRLNALLNGHLEQFSLDALVNLAARTGLSVRVSATRPYRRA